MLTLQMKYFACRHNALFVAHYKLLSLVYYLLVASSYHVISDSTITSNTSTTIPKRYRLATKLIHPDSIPLSERFLRRGTESNAIYSLTQTSTSSGYHYYYDDVQGNVTATMDVFPDKKLNGFLVNMSIGEPSVPQLLVMDTGSQLLWIQCTPCVYCTHQTYTPIFNPMSSSTYRVFPCGDDNDPTCSDLVPGGQCSTLNGCTYFVKYVDKTNSTGVLGIDSFAFIPHNDHVEPSDNTLVQDVVFGCGRENHNMNGEYTGILGLGASDISLVSQLGTKFSYCIGNMSDPHYTYNHLTIGDGAITSQGYTTPMEIHNGHYYLSLEKIMVGEKMLDIDSKVFKRRGNVGVMIDSGATYTYLTRDAYIVLSAEVERLMDGVMRRVVYPGHEDALCYKGVLGRDLKGFPGVTFRFSGEVDLVLGVESMFKQGKNEYVCMAVRLSEANGLHDGLSLIGLMAQQYYNVGYDLAAKTLSFLGIDCQLVLV